MPEPAPGTLLIADDDELALESLLTWLSRSPEVTRHGRPQPVGGTTGTGTMDDAVAVIALVISGASALADVFAVCRAWSETRNRPPTTTITIGEIHVHLSDPAAGRKLQLPGEEHGPAA